MDRIFAAGIPIDDSDIADLGEMLVLMMSMEQLEKAHRYYALNHAPRPLDPASKTTEQWQGSMLQGPASVSFDSPP